MTSLEPARCWLASGRGSVRGRFLCVTARSSATWPRRRHRRIPGTNPRSREGPLGRNFPRMAISPQPESGRNPAEPCTFTMLVDPGLGTGLEAIGVELLAAWELIRVKPRQARFFTCPQLREQVAELLTTGFIHLAIDLRGLSFIDAGGVRLLRDLAGNARSGGGAVADATAFTGSSS